MNFSTYIEIAVAIIAAYAAAVVAALLVIRRCGDGTEDGAAKVVGDEINVVATNVRLCPIYATLKVKRA